MIDQGANPFVVSYDDYDEFSLFDLAKSKLINLPEKKSVYFTTRPLADEFNNKTDFLHPWFYETGVFGKFDSVIGQGASGIVLSGDWFGRKAAFKFVEIGAQKFEEVIEEGLKVLDDKLTEMTSIQATAGSKIVRFFGHYR